MSDEKLNQILSLVAEHVKEKNQKKKFEKGKDIVWYAGPWFTEEEYLAAVKTLLSGWLGLGKDAMHFERGFCHHLGKRHGVLTNSGSSANLLMVSALLSKNAFNLPRGSRVITPAAGFPTTLNPIIQLGLEPVFVDIDIQTLAPNLDQVEEKAKDAKAIMFAHPLGNCPDMNRVMEIVKKNDLIFLEDCCDALGSTYDGKPLGSFGELASCSFYPAHHMTIGEGGFVATSNKALEDVVRSLRDWGRDCICSGRESHNCPNGTCNKRFSAWVPALPQEVFDHRYIYGEIGYNLKPIELQASIGLEQIKKLPAIHLARKTNHAALSTVFEEYQKFFILPKATENCDPSWFAFAVTVKADAPFKREQLCRFLEFHKIQTRMFFGGNLLLQPAYRGIADGLPFVNSTFAMTNTFFLGTSPVVTTEQIEYIKEILSLFMKPFK